MKELSIKEKAKRFDEALERARRYYDEYKTRDNILYVEDMEDMFPELKESENERIKKFLTKCVKENMFVKSFIADNFDKDEVLAWIEKQGEPKEYDVCDNCDQQGSCVSPCCVKLVEKNDEQKPTDKVEPKFKVGDAIRLKNSNAEYIIESISDSHYYGKGFSISIVGGNRDYELVEQKPAWSEEDEDVINLILSICSDFKNSFRGHVGAAVEDDIKKIDKWLKSLKDKVQTQSTWKPSDRELAAILTVIGDEKQKGSDVVKELRNIYQQLKKLREE